MQTTSLEARYAADCERLLGRVRRRFRRDFVVPAEVVQEAIWACNFRIACEELESDTDLAVCDADRRRVVLCKDFALKLQCPWMAHQVRNFTLAHELGHVRLHAQLLRAGEWEAHWEEEATFYARVFLIPRRLLKRRLETGSLIKSRLACQEILWEHVLSLAEAFCVSGKFMVHTLDAYGLIRFDPATRWIQVRQPGSLSALPSTAAGSRA